MNSDEKALSKLALFQFNERIDLSGDVLSKSLFEWSTANPIARRHNEKMAKEKGGDARTIFIDLAATFRQTPKNRLNRFHPSDGTYTETKLFL